MKRRLVIAGIGALAHFGAKGIVPATDLQIFCGASNVFVGQVASVASLDCRLDAVREGRKVEFCSLTNMLWLSVQPAESLGRVPQAPSLTNPISLYCHLNDAIRVPGRWIGLDFVKDAPELTEANLQTFLQGKRFIFGAHLERSVPIAGVPSPTYYTTIWSLERRQWVEQVMTPDGRGCEKLRRE